MALQREREKAAEAKIERQQRRMEEMQAQLLDSMEQKRELADQALLASQEKICALRELRRVEKERKALQAQLQEANAFLGHEKGSRPSSVCDSLLNSVQGELERLQQQMESTRIVYDENERLKRHCHALEMQLEVAKRERDAALGSYTRAGDATSQVVGRPTSSEEMLFTVRHARQGYKSMIIEVIDGLLIYLSYRWGHQSGCRHLHHFCSRRRCYTKRT